MPEYPHLPSGLSKAIWTEADFAEMGWHDSHIHALSIAEMPDGQLPPARLRPRRRWNRPTSVPALRARAGQ